MYLSLYKRKHFRYEKAYVRVWKNTNSLSLGQYLFVSEDYNKFLLAHEYGHSFQSLYLGPLYLLIIGVPSSIWCNSKSMAKYRRKRHMDYYDAPFEKSANRLGHRHSKRFG